MRHVSFEDHLKICNFLFLWFLCICVGAIIEKQKDLETLNKIVKNFFREIVMPVDCNHLINSGKSNLRRIKSKSDLIYRADQSTSVVRQPPHGI